jgi:membrane-associated protease RseP (regulator of RpoE activity)
MKLRRILFALLALMLLPLVAARADDKAKDKKDKEIAQDKPITVPFEMLKTGHITVMVKVNGKGPYKLIFDTGAPLTLINNKVAKEAGLLKDAKKPLFSPFGSMGEAKIETLEVGDQKAENVAAMVMDHPTVQAISNAFMKETGPIDGIVGFPFFARFKMTLDYQAKTLTFLPNGYNPPDVIKAMTTALTAELTNPDTVKILSPAAQWGFLANKDEKDDDAGVTVKEVFPGGAAAAAGLKAGDRLLTIDGRWTDSITDLYRAAEYIKPGATAPVTVRRDGKEITLKVKPTMGL